MLNKQLSHLRSILIASAILVAAASGGIAQGGAAQQRGQNTDNKADSNLRSMARVNPSTLAMELNIPLISYRGRNGNSQPVNLSYSSKLWRMKSMGTYFYVTPIGRYRQYVTQLRPRFAERSVAGWTSSVAFPMIEEKLETFDESGNPFQPGMNIDGFNFLFEQASSNEPDCGLLNNPNLPCGWACVERTRWCYDGVCTEWQCTGWDWNTANCSGTGGGGTSCDYDANGFCPAECPYCTRSQCPPWYPNCSDNPDIPTTQIEPPARTHYVKRVHVRMGDGSTIEFRKSDGIFGYCSGGTNPSDGPNCEGTGADNSGTFVSVDGSGLRLVRDTNGSTLFLSDGSRYLFPNESTGAYDGTTLYQSNVFIDTNGNRSTFNATNEENELTTNPQKRRVLTDTLGRKIYDPLALNLSEQQQVEGVENISLPGLEGNTQNYQLKWLHLKPVPCTSEVTTNCGSSEGALENQNENVHFFTGKTCQGSAENSVDPNNQYPNEILFPLNGLGLRSCNPGFTNSAGIVTPLRFNPVVLAEIVLPNQKKYEFKYNQFGEITKIVNPSGTVETFTYSQIPPLNGFNEGAYDQTNRGVIERKVYNAEGQLIQRWQYSAVLQQNNYSNPTYKVTTTASKATDALADGAKTERLLHVDTEQEHPFGFNDPLAGMPKEEIVKDENNIIRSRTLTEWVVKGAIPTNDPLRPEYVSATRDARVKRTISITIEDGQALAVLNETDYETPGENGSAAPIDIEYFAHLNVKRTKSHHFRNIPLSLAQTGTLEQIASYFNASTVATIGETDYLYYENYKARGISSLPVESRAKDPSDNSTITRTQTKYDNLLPNISTGYPSSYTLESYGISGAYSCGLAAPNYCWTDPATQYRGKPTTTRVWNKDDDTWIETHTRYDIFGNAIKVKDPVGNEASTTYEDSTAKPYRYAYPTRVDTPAPDPTGTRGTNQGSFTTTTYDFMTGLPLTVTDEFGQTTATEYNDPLLRPTRVYGVGSYVIPITETIYDDAARTVKVRKQIDATNWDEVTTFYDSLGRTIKTQSKDSQGDVIVETKYDFLGRVQMVSNPYRQGTNPANVVWSLTEYDELGRVKQTREPVANQNPSTPTGNILGTTAYDISTAPGFIGTVVTTTDAAGKKSRSITNALGQLIRVDEPDHAGGLLPLPQSTPEPLPTPTPRRTPPIDPPPTCSVGCLTNAEYPSYATVYLYDALGKMVEVIQGVQHRFFKYDSLGRLIRVRQPEQEVNSSLNLADAATGNSEWTAGFAYDVLGNVVRATDANGVNIINEYDRAGRVTKRCYTKPNVATSATTCAQIPTGDQSIDTPAVNFWYDGKGLAQQQSPNFAKGKLTKVGNLISETRYLEFDYLGRVKTMDQATPAADETFATAPRRESKYTYNLSGALIEETYPSGRKVRNEFESDGDLARIYGTANQNAAERTYANSFLYTPDGKIERLRLGNGLWERATFNSRLQVTSLNLGRGLDGDLWKLGYEYGELNSDGTVDTSKNTGNIARQTVSFNGLSQPLVQYYKYDSLYRLTEARETAGTGTGAPQTWKETFSYDRYGNRTAHQKFVGTNLSTSTNVTDPTIDPATNRFQSGQGYTFDKNGNLIADAENRSFGFNADNKQIKVAYSGQKRAEYFYDGEGKRVKKKVYNQANPLEVDEETIFVYSSGKLIAEYSTAPVAQNLTTSYTATDQLGSPRVITNSLGDVVSRRDFMPFGEQVPVDGTHRTLAAYPAGDNIRQKFTGYQKDEETQLDFAEARMYENRHGRFTAVDPLLASGKSANPQTFNRYVYVLNNPLILTDPDGLQVATTPRLPGGRWYQPTNPDGVKTVRFELCQPDGYEPVTTRDRRGNLVYTPQGTRESFNGKPEYLVRLNENGPEKALPLVDSRTGKSVTQELTDFQKQGWEVIKGPGWGALNLPPGVQDVSLDLYFAGSGVGSLGRAGFSAIGRSLAAREADSLIGTNAFRYVTEGELQAIKETGLLRGGRPGETFFTKDLYKSTERATERLSLETPATHRVEFQFLNNPMLERNGTRVLPDFLRRGGGNEFSTFEPVRVRLINVQPLRPQ